MQKLALCKEGICELGILLCCRDCKQKWHCPELCDGEEQGSCESDCAWRVEKVAE